MFLHLSVSHSVHGGGMHGMGHVCHAHPLPRTLAMHPTTTHTPLPHMPPCHACPLPCTPPSHTAPATHASLPSIPSSMHASCNASPPCQAHPGDTTRCSQWVVGTHRTGMHSCLFIDSLSFFQIFFFLNKLQINFKWISFEVDRYVNLVYTLDLSECIQSTAFHSPQFTLWIGNIILSIFVSFLKLFKPPTFVVVTMSSRYTRQRLPDVGSFRKICTTTGECFAT